MLTNSIKSMGDSLRQPVDMNGQEPIPKIIPFSHQTIRPTIRL